MTYQPWTIEKQNRIINQQKPVKNHLQLHTFVGFLLVNSCYTLAISEVPHCMILHHIPNVVHIYLLVISRSVTQDNINRRPFWYIYIYNIYYHHLPIGCWMWGTLFKSTNQWEKDIFYDWGHSADTPPAAHFLRSRLRSRFRCSLWCLVLTNTGDENSNNYTWIYIQDSYRKSNMFVRCVIFVIQYLIVLSSMHFHILYIHMSSADNEIWELNYINGDLGQHRAHSWSTWIHPGYDPNDTMLSILSYIIR